MQIVGKVCCVNARGKPSKKNSLAVGSIVICLSSILLPRYYSHSELVICSFLSVTILLSLPLIYDP